MVLLQLLVVTLVQEELGALVQRYCVAQARRGSLGTDGFQGLHQRGCHTGVLAAISAEIVETIVEELAMRRPHCVSSQESDHVRDVETAGLRSGSGRGHAKAGTWQVYRRRQLQSAVSAPCRDCVILSSGLNQGDTSLLDYLQFNIPVVFMKLQRIVRL